MQILVSESYASQIVNQTVFIISFSNPTDELSPVLLDAEAS